MMYTYHIAQPPIRLASDTCMPDPSVFAFASLRLRRTRFALAISAWLRHA